MANKTLATVVVTYNRLPKLKATIARLLESPSSDLAHVVVVNNASTDGTGEWLDGLSDPRLTVTHEPINTGGAGGFCRGMREAVDRFDPDWIMVTDDDGRPDPDALATFQSLDTSPYDGIAAAVYFPSGEICEMNRPSRNPFWHLGEFAHKVVRGHRWLYLTPESYDLNAPTPIEMSSFVGFFISRRGIAMVGYPDPDLFIYGDDGIYTLDLAAKGGRMCFEPRIRFEHDMATFAGQQSGQFRPLWKLYYHHRNLLILYQKAAGLLYWPLLPVILLKWVLKIRTYSQDRHLFVRLMWRALWDGLRDRRKVEHDQILGIIGKTQER
ncbi:Glycosyltransferase, GT2 family [Aliiroseovarius halocynthiae]|uniref:Glycosyltransferase n=1 Tax=Aliiroseovarius halocynthiae TaxID=985055 RepID=A0A545SYC2_9RHOB|nr:glycosyltransferase [Aliiroseovarius halocynthiae]TQV69960.1 glycosyltransferase [Aliiroseovarius halocynthiae]SMR70623.1 Glycosyltransferase, GT2 family [Aliiroseovarius halocynthiae]